jgi:hypothetical protein
MKKILLLSLMSAVATGSFAQTKMAKTSDMHLTQAATTKGNITIPYAFRNGKRKQQ